MHKPMRLFAAIGFCVLLSPVAARAEATADEIAPFLDETVVAVARLELDALEPEAFAHLLQPPVAQNGGTERLAELLQNIRDTLQDLGVERLYAVYSLNNLGGEMPHLIVPAPDDQRAERAAAYLFTGDPDGPTSLDAEDAAAPSGLFEVCEPIGHTVFCGSRAARQRLDEMPTPQRPGLSDALAAAAETPLAFLVAPTDDQRRVVREMWPPLPAEAGGLAGAEIADNLKWIVFLVAPAGSSYQLLMETTDPEFAGKMAASVPRLLSALGLQAEGNAASSWTGHVEESRALLTLESSDGTPALVTTLLRTLSRAAVHSDAMRSLKQIALAMHNFHDQWDSFPPLASYDDEGRPLLSWRVFLLPYLDEPELYERFRFDEPWDSPHNRELIPLMPEVFKSESPALNLDGKTRFLLPVADETPWHGRLGTPIREITDGTSNTIMVLQAGPDRAVTWTQPEDLPIDWENVRAGLDGSGGTFAATLCDGSAHRLPIDIPADLLTRLLQHQDGRPIDWSNVHPPD